MAQVTLKGNTYNVLFLQCDLAVTWQEVSEDYRSSCLPYATPRHSMCQTLRIWQSKACYSQYLFFLSICTSIKKSKQFEESSYFVSLDHHDSNIPSLQVKMCCCFSQATMGSSPSIYTGRKKKWTGISFIFFYPKFSFTWRMQRKRKTVLVLLVSDFHVTVCISFEPAVLLYAYVWLHLCGTMLTWVKHHVDTEICPPISCKSQDQEHSLFIGCSWRSKALESACRVTVYALCFPTQSHQGTMLLSRN